MIEKRARKPFSLGDVPCGFRPKKTMMMRPLFATKSRFIFKEAREQLVKDTLRSCQLLGHDSFSSPLVNIIITRMFAQHFTSSVK